MFQRVRHRVLDIQPVVKPNDKWCGKRPHNAIQGAAVSVLDQQLRGEFDQELGAAAEVLALLIVRHGVREIQLADEAERSLGRWKRWSWLLRCLLLVLVGGVSKGLPVFLRHFMHRIGRDGGFCFDICFFS